MTWQEAPEEAADFLTSETALTADIAALAMAGGAFAWLADEPDLYDDTCGEAIG